MMPGRRKVFLWSKRPWQRVDQIGSSDLPPGRFVQGRTLTAFGPVDVIGVCVPWSGAHVATGRRDRRRWEDHVTYLNALTPVIEGIGETLIVVGDYNQKIPRTIAPQPIYDALDSCILTRLETPTRGRLGPLDVQVIDHMSHSSDLTAVAVQAISNVDARGKALCDHVGVAVVLTGSDQSP